MTSASQTILVLGATSGIGEAFARRFHAQGKTVIATGRRAPRLAELRADLPGLETRQFDITDLSSLPTHWSALIKDFPALDSVLVSSGIQASFDFKTPASSSDESIANEVTTNLTAPMLLARLAIPHLLALGRPANFILVSSGLAYVPFPTYPVYCPTKAAIHTFSIMLRAQVAGTNVNVIELAPPYVDTGLDAGHRSKVIEAQGGEEKATKPMSLEEYMEKAGPQLDEVDGEGRPKKEVAVGFAQMGVDAWRGTFGPVLENFGINA